MGRRDDQRKIKLDILSKIHKKKELLFGSFSPTLSKEDKKRGWAAVTAHAHALGVGCGAVSANPNYMRDIWWQNARKSTLEKLDIAKEPGGAELIAKRWSEFDDVILRIMDKEPPDVDVGAGGSDTECAYPPLDDVTPEGPKESDDPLLPADAECDASVKREGTAAAARVPGAWRSENSVPKYKLETRHPCDAKSKVELEMELLRVQIYKARLEARQLEMSMFLPASAHTADVAAAGPRPRPRRRRPRSDHSSDSFT